MIKLLVGLGNPGQMYEKNRHNVGFLFLERLLFDLHGNWTKDSKFHGTFATCQLAQQKLILLKPATFMNRSGQAVGAVARYYGITAEEILVIHDELDFAAGLLKLKKGGGHAGHNGLRDIIAHLQSNDFYRLRIGIGRPAAGKPVADYVLSDPGKTEMIAIENAFDSGLQFLPRIVAGDIAAVMNELHGKIA
jgi:PTH1 family peptidyl-tRNA hydrolase